MAINKKVIIICGLSDEFPHNLPGIETPCKGCGKTLWLSYSSIKDVIRVVKNVTAEMISPICMPCNSKGDVEEELIKKKD